MKCFTCFTEQWYTCILCYKRFKHASSLSRHRHLHKQRCMKCKGLITPWKTTKHKCLELRQQNRDNRNGYTDDEPLTIADGFQVDCEFIEDCYSGIYKAETKNLIRKNWSAIRSFVMHKAHSAVYNLRIENNNLHATLHSSNVKTLFNDQKVKFKINAAIGYILLNQNDNELRYWHASQGVDRLFDTPSVIEDEKDFKNFIAAIGDTDFSNNVMLNRPNTSWTIHAITNLTLYVYPIPEHSIGCPVQLSEITKRNKAIISADTDSNGQHYQNNLCFFRALALARQQKSTLEKSTKNYFEMYMKAINMNEEEFHGVPLNKLSLAERVFRISINVYELMYDDNKKSVARLLYRASTNYTEKLNLHLENQHFCYIKNLKLYTQSYKCLYCSKLVKTAHTLKMHTLSCPSDSVDIYPSGLYETRRSVFDRLEDVGIMVDQSRRHYPFFAAIDCESWLDSSGVPNKTKTIEYQHQHRLASISICSNVAGYTDPVCFINDSASEYKVVEQTMKYLECLSDVCSLRLKTRYRDVYRRIQNTKDAAIETEMMTQKCDGVEKLEQKFTKLTEALDSYLRDLPVYTFNGSAYDYPLIKHHMLKYLIDNEKGVDFIAKRGNKYLCIQCPKLRFLDIANFLAPGFSYSDYLKAMEVEGEKSHWIYDQFTSMEVLNRTEFPSHSEFYSELKQENITVEEYQKIKAIWEQRNMKTLRDFLRFYNDCDVKYFISALERQNEFYKSRGLDFKSAISVPGLAIQYLFQLKNSEPIFMFGYKFSDIYHLIKENIRGGLSVVFNRYQEAGVTKIKPEHFGENAKLAKACVGYDANSLYLHCLTKPMPSGLFVRRRAENGYKLEKSYTHGVKAVEWIEWMGSKLNIRFKHKFNGQEQRVGGRELPVDGFGVAESGVEVVLNYSGCWFHSHLCSKAPIGVKKDRSKDLQNQLETLRNLEYFRKLGYIVYHTFECEFDELKAKDPSIHEFCQTLKYLPDTRPYLTENMIIEDIKSGKIFGMAVVDLHTPDHLKEIFSEFQPIQKHAYISRQDIGEHMLKFAQENDLLKKPTKALINSFFAEKILLATPLLQWYLKHGLECTKVHQLIQFKPSKCFEKFGDEVSAARREGDVDSSKKIIADSCKLLGNSAYGKTLTNVAKHDDIKVCRDDQTAVGALVNNGRFKSLEESENGLIEIQLAKSKIRHNVPVQIGFFVLEYAKLAMLHFYYDFLIKFLPLDGFCLIQCDTDSLYFALSEKNLYLAVKPEMRTQFVHEHNRWLVADYCPEHQHKFFNAMFNDTAWQPEECCISSSLYNKRTPGLFHCENVSTGIVALCSKCYYCFGTDDKYSSKGVSKRFNHYTKHDYLEVLRTQKINQGVNKGFKIKGDKIFTYTQRRKGLNYMYCKRKVANDGVTTFPTDL